MPFAITPMGMCNIVSPDADRLLAQETARRNVPYCLSCAASTDMAATGRHVDGRVLVDQAP